MAWHQAQESGSSCSFLSAPSSARCLQAWEEADEPQVSGQVPFKGPCKGDMRDKIAERLWGKASFGRLEGDRSGKQLGVWRQSLSRYVEGGIACGFSMLMLFVCMYVYTELCIDR